MKSLVYLVVLFATGNTGRDLGAPMLVEAEWQSNLEHAHYFVGKTEGPESGDAIHAATVLLQDLVRSQGHDSLGAGSSKMRKAGHRLFKIDTRQFPEKYSGVVSLKRVMNEKKRFAFECEFPNEPDLMLVRKVADSFETFARNLLPRDVSQEERKLIVIRVEAETTKDMRVRKFTATYSGGRFD